MVEKTLKIESKCLYCHKKMNNWSFFYCSNKCDQNYHSIIGFKKLMNDLQEGFTYDSADVLI